MNTLKQNTPILYKGELLQETASVTRPHTVYLMVLITRK
jgi:hypothetical protein